MDHRRLCRRLAILVLGVSLVAMPVAAQSVNRAVIDELNKQLLYVALPLTLFVEVTLVYAIFRFRNNDDPSPTVDDPALELTWTTATAVILLFVGLAAYIGLANPYLTPTAAGSSPADAAAVEGDELVVEVTGYQWGWQFHYPEEDVTTHGRMVVPVDRDVRFELRSRDVIHAMFVPDLGIKQDIIPGSEATARTRATETGSYRLYCAELCGVGHAEMQGTVVVMNETNYEEWVAEQTDETAS